jgi:hypothetical protein
MTESTFTCDMCGEEYIKGWSDAAAMAEYERDFPAEVEAGEETAVVCGVCYTEFMAWFTQESPR